MYEQFGKISIDRPSTLSTLKTETTTQPTEVKVTASHRYSDGAEAIAPAEGEGFRMVPLRKVLEAVRLQWIAEVKTDDMSILRSRLYTYGLRLGCYLPGKTTIALDEEVPIYSRDIPEVSSRGTTLVAIFMTAWMLSADTVTAADVAIVDRWLESQETRHPEMAIATQAAFHWLVGRRLVLSKARKRRISSLAKFRKRREAIVSFLLTLMANPDISTPKRMQRLQTLYSLVGLNPDDIHTDIHRLSSGTSVRRSADCDKKVIDHTRLRTLTQDTLKAQDILADVFDTAEPEVEQSATPSADTYSPAQPLAWFLEHIASQAEWSRDCLDAYCRQTGVILGDTLEKINDIAYDTLDSPVAEEDGDIVYVDQDIANQLIENLHG